MRKLLVTKLEGNFAICEEYTEKKPTKPEKKDKKKDIAYFGIEIAELPEKTVIGDILTITDEGEISVAHAAQKT